MVAAEGTLSNIVASPHERRKTMGKFFMSVAIAAIVAMGAVNTANAQNAVTWDVGKGIALGSGCSSFGRTPDTAILAIGADLAIIYSKLGVTGPNQLANCSVRIPAMVRQGYYVTQFQPTITYGVIKSYGTIAKLTALTSFLNQPVSSLTVDVPIFAMSSLVAIESELNPDVFIDACSHALTGLFRTDLAIGTQGTGQIVIPAPGYDVRYDIVVTAFSCASPWRFP
jgi:hypothetical protein